MDNAIPGHPIISEQGTSWESFCEDIWGYLDPTSKESFWLRSQEFRYETRECFIKLDFDRLSTITRAYNWVSPRVQQGEAALFFEVAALDQTLLIADACANLRLFDQAYKLVSVAMEIMDAEFHPRPNLTHRLHALHVIGECKWQQPKSTRDKLWSPEWMLDEFEMLSEQVFSSVKKNPALDQTGTTVDHMKRTSFVLLKVAARYLPKELPGLIEKFNLQWGASLYVEEGHFLANDPPGKLKCYYWDFEIAKLYLGENLTLEELDYCHERLIEAAKDEFDEDPRNYLLSIDLQYRFFAKPFTKILEFPIG